MSKVVKSSWNLYTSRKYGTFCAKEERCEMSQVLKNISGICLFSHFSRFSLLRGLDFFLSTLFFYTIVFKYRNPISKSVKNSKITCKTKHARRAPSGSAELNSLQFYDGWPSLALCWRDKNITLCWRCHCIHACEIGEKSGSKTAGLPENTIDGVLSRTRSVLLV